MPRRRAGCKRVANLLSAAAVSESDLSCRLQGRCPGCPLGAAPYAVGLARKGQALRAALEPYRDLTPELLAPRGATTTLAYRLRAKLVSHGRALGLYERGSHRVLDIGGCPVLSPALTRASDALRRALPLPIYGADLRETSEGVLVTLLTEQEQALGRLREASRELVERGAALGVAVAARRPGDVRLLSGEPEVVAGPSAARHALGPDAPYAYAAHGGFVQAHPSQARYVYDEIARGLRERVTASASPRVLELFAGNGSLALSLAQAGARVTAVESYAPAISLAERAAREQGLALSVHAGDASRFAEGLAPGRFDAVVVNPPRRGLDPALRRSIALAEPSVLAYVSCNPHTFARDAWQLASLGLALERAEPLDMIPWSDAIEVLAWFRPAAPPPPRVLFEDHELVAIDKLPHDDAEQCLRRVRALPSCEHAVALDGWGAGVSGVTWFSKRGGGASGFELAERELSTLCRGNLRKQGTIARPGSASPGAKYQKRAEVGRHSLLRVVVGDRDEQGVLGDFGRIRHPVLGDTTHGDRASNDFLQHRHGLDRSFLHVELGRWRSGSRLFEARTELGPDLSRVLASLASD